jgi:hypothetical protein
MTNEALSFPAITEHRQYARLPPHSGASTFRIEDMAVSGLAEFILPVDGQAVVAFRATTGVTSQDLGTDLVIEGDSEFGAFRIECPQCYVPHQINTHPDTSGWSLISPINRPVRVRYGSTRPVSKLSILLNNFDYTHGDALTSDTGFTVIGTPITANLGHHRITFRHHRHREHVLPLVEAGVLRSASLTEVICEVRPEHSDATLLEFGSDVAAVCTFAAGMLVSTAMFDLLDDEGAVVRRLIPQPVVSRYRDTRIIRDIHLPGFLRVAFGEYVKMKQTHAPWHKLAGYCGTLEDPLFLEQKFASLIMAVEFFTRN